MIYWELLLSFMQIGLFSIGGGYASMPLIQAQVVDKYHWPDHGGICGYHNDFTDDPGAGGN